MNTSKNINNLALNMLFILASLFLFLIYPIMWYLYLIWNIRVRDEQIYEG